ncbi:MAG: tetratricopeptide repeat protein [Succinivibrionaceae bacterium]
MKHFLRNSVTAIVFLLFGSTSFATCADNMQKGEWLMALKNCTKEAEGNSPTKGEAYYFLGMLSMVQFDEAIAIDPVKSYKSFSESAKLGYFPSYYALADAYYHGLGVQANPTQAFYWADKSAHAGDPDGAIYLSNFYHNAYATEQNEGLAKLWLMVARIKFNEFDEQTQIYFDNLIGVMEKEDRILLLKDATECISSNYQNCTYSLNK